MLDPMFSADRHIARSLRLTLAAGGRMSTESRCFRTIARLTKPKGKLVLSW
jgi:hypothetical protein